MMDTFHESSTTLFNRHVQDWKTGGGHVVGYTCSYVPDEIFHAGGILPYRLRGIEAKEMNIGDAYFGPFICSLPKCLLQLAGEGKYHFLDGVIVTPGCDSMRRLDDCWRKAGEDRAEALPSFFFHYAVPHKTAAYSIKWFIEETQRLKDAVEKHFSVTISEDQLHEAIAIYKAEPYVMAADVYAVSPHTGRGGWTWYTGSAGWMYRLIVESLLGLKLEVDKLRFTPCLPADWPGFTMHYRYRETVYHITIKRPPAGDGETRVTVDGVGQPDNTIPLIDDHQEHYVEINIPVGRN